MNLIKKYKVILADPPWKYGGSGVTYRCADNHYSVMKASEIKKLPIFKVAHPNCILLLWVTWPQLVNGIDVIAAWGFTYVTGFPWLKVKDISKDLWGNLDIRVRYGIGHWFRGCSEMLLLARKGNVSPPSGNFTGLLSPSVVHSRKPKHIYEYAETLDGPYLELFARKKRKGWDSWGNEIESDISLATAVQNKSLESEN